MLHWFGRHISLGTVKFFSLFQGWEDWGEVPGLCLGRSGRPGKVEFNGQIQVLPASKNWTRQAKSSIKVYLKCQIETGSAERVWIKQRKSTKEKIIKINKKYVLHLRDTVWAIMKRYDGPDVPTQTPPPPGARVQGPAASPTVITLRTLSPWTSLHVMPRSGSTVQLMRWPGSQSFPRKGLVVHEATLL